MVIHDRLTHQPVIKMFETSWDKTQGYPWKRVTVPHWLAVTGSDVYNTAALFPSYERIEYETGSDGRFRDCLHNEFRSEFWSSQMPYAYLEGSGGNSHLSLCTQDDVNAAMNELEAPEIDMEAYADEALAHMLPRINQGSSLVNYILELKDLKHSNPIPSIKRIFTRKMTHKNLITKSDRKAFAKEVAGRLAGAHLNASFGIVPLLRDSVQMMDDLLDLKFRVEQIKQRANRNLVRHYKRVIPLGPGEFASREPKWSVQDRFFNFRQVNYDRAGGGVRDPIRVTRRGAWIKRPTYHATLRYSYTVPKLGQAEERIKTQMDVLGLNLNPAIIWNAIPFTFLLDWMVNVSELLNSIRRDNWPIETHVHEFCHSYTWHSEHRVSVRGQSFRQADLAPALFESVPGPSEVILWTGQQRHYTRKRHHPNLASIKARAPRLRQIALAGSLIVSKKIRPQYLRAPRYAWTPKAQRAVKVDEWTYSDKY